MWNRGPLTVLAAAITSFTVGCGPAKDSFFSRTALAEGRGKARAVALSVPLGCLETPGCFSGGGSSGAWEASTATTTTFSEALRGPLSSSATASSDPARFGTDEAASAALADAYLLKIKNDLHDVSCLSRDTSTAAPPQADILSEAGILSDVPENLSRALREYAKSEACRSCSRMVNALTRLRVREPEWKTRLQILHALYPRYVEACFGGRLTDLGDPRNRLVVLLRRDEREVWRPGCLGFNYVGNLVLTARHCLVERSVIEDAEHSQSCIPVTGPLPGTRAVVLGEAGLFDVGVPPLGLVRQTLDFFPFRPDQDTAVLEIKGGEERARRVSAFPMDEPREWDAIFIPGLLADHREVSAAIRNLEDPDRLRRVIEEGSAVNTSPLCMLAFPTRTAEPFVYHACQTYYGFSGAPILRRESGGRPGALIGVHTGTIRPDRPVGGWPHAALFPNYGLRIPQHVRAGNGATQTEVCRNDG